MVAVGKVVPASRPRQRRVSFHGCGHLHTIPPSSMVGKSVSRYGGTGTGRLITTCLTIDGIGSVRVSGKEVDARRSKPAFTRLCLCAVCAGRRREKERERESKREEMWRDFPFLLLSSLLSTHCPLPLCPLRQRDHRELCVCTCGGSGSGYRGQASRVVVHTQQP